MVCMVFRDVFDLHEQYSAFSYGQPARDILQDFVVVIHCLRSYLPVFAAARGSCTPFPIYVIVECNMKPFYLIFILA